MVTKQNGLLKRSANVVIIGTLAVGAATCLRQSYTPISVDSVGAFASSIKRNGNDFASEVRVEAKTLALSTEKKGDATIKRLEAAPESVRDVIGAGGFFAIIALGLAGLVHKLKEQ
ncbi:MAG: hypothetical protein ABSE71_02205 [Candidatus Micrarchaeaceae archaeon]|jgi:hypothetical protein|nr:hypothetical protein [Candidatus Micrarchaeota archaeon]